MRNISVALLVVVLGPLAARAQGGWADKLFSEGTTHDFGSVARGAQLYHRFLVKNIYAVPLTVMDVRASCGCVTATPTFKTLGPRETGYIEIMMDGRKFTGQKSVRVNLTFGPEYSSTAELRISAYSRADVVFNPSQVTFGVVARGATPTQTIDVEYAGTLDWRVNSVVPNGTPVDVRLKELYRRPERGFNTVGYRVEMTLKADAPSGALKHEVLLQTNDPATPTVPVLVEATVQAAVAVSPENLRAPDLKVGQEKVMRVQVRGSRPFRVLGLEGDAEGVSLGTPAPSAPSESQMVLLKFQPTQPGDFRRQVQIKTDLQDAPLTVNVEGRAAP